MTFAEAQSAYIEDLNALPDWLDKYQYLLQIAGVAAPLPKQCKTEEHRLKSCQADTWLTGSEEDGKLYFRADSEALLVKGILNILTELYSGRTAKEVLNAQFRLLEETGIERNIPASRANGIYKALEWVRDYAQEGR